MHTVWKGAISFGLVHVPVKMFAATEDKDVHLRYIHKECGTPIAYTRSCPHCDKLVEWEEIVKGYEYEKGRFVLFDEKELDAIKPESTRTIQLLDFVALEEIDPMYYQKTYFLSPDQAGGGAYSLLLEAMKQSGRIGIAKVAIRSKSSLAAIRAVDNCLCMETMYYPDEIRSLQAVPNLPAAPNVSERELSMAKLLIDQLSGPFEPSKYTDDYRTALMDAIQRKMAGEGPDIVAAPAAERTNVIDLMAALQASLEAVKPGATTGGATAGNAAAGGAATGNAATGSADAASGARGGAITGNAATGEARSGAMTGNAATGEARSGAMTGNAATGEARSGAMTGNAATGEARSGAMTGNAAGSGTTAAGTDGESGAAEADGAPAAKRKPVARGPSAKRAAAGAEPAAGGGAAAPKRRSTSRSQTGQEP